MIHSIQIQGGFGKNGGKDQVDKLEMKMGDVVSIVGPTGSGKTTLINDIELFARGDTPTKRCIFINGEIPSDDYRYDPSANPIALITQHTNFLSDMQVKEFLHVHAMVRTKDKTQVEKMIQETISFANQLTGEPIDLHCRMTELSGGQTRALLIADATIICNTPIVLLDEVENAGINRSRALELLRQYRKIFVFVTHDPHIALLSDYRLVMEEGRIKKIQYSTEIEKHCSTKVAALDEFLATLREKLRHGSLIEEKDFEVIL